MRELSEIDERILEESRKQFLEQGIMNTEMKDIAKRLGCSRSTLYRHFANKGDILLLLAQRALAVIDRAVKIPADKTFTCGYEALEWQMKSMVQTLVLHIDEVTFLRDFDCLFTKEYPDTDEKRNFLYNASNSASLMYVTESILRGIQDGSIKGFKDPDLLALTITNASLSMAQRILPREALYIEEHGYGRELLRCQMEVLMASVKNN